MQIALEPTEEHTVEQETYGTDPAEEHTTESAGSTEHVEETAGHGAEGGAHVLSIKPDILGYYQGFPITNSLVTSWLVMAVLIILALVIKFNVSLIPTSKFYNFVEMVVDGVYGLVENLAHKKTKVFFPIVATFFFYILTANLLGLFPGFGTISFNGHHLLRSINSDLNMTLGLAITSILTTHIFAIYYLGILDYLKKWFSLNPIFLFVGLLELVGEFTKTVSLSLRLFGNIFAGEVVLSTISNLLAFVAPLPFYFLEIIVAIVQAAVFMMLTLVFMVLLSEKHASH